MKKYNKIMTALDLSKLDDTLVPFTHQMAKWLDSRDIIGAHVIPVLLIADLIKVDPENYFLPVAPAVEKIREAIFNEIKIVFGETDLSLKVKVEEGRPFSKLLKMVKDAQPDLLIFGKKGDSGGSGITARRIAHHVDTDFLLVPDGASPKFKKILLPLDFSENSFRAFQFVEGLQKTIGMDTPVNALNIIDVLPERQYGDFEIYENLSELLPEKAAQQYEDFQRHYGLNESNLNLVFKTTDDQNIANTILNYAQQNNYDLIVIGATGHTLFENFIFGSVTETLMDVNHKIPILVIR